MFHGCWVPGLLAGGSVYRRLFLQGMEYRLSLLEGTEFLEANLPEQVAHLGEVIREMLCLMGIRADCQDMAAQIMIKLQDRPGRHGVLELVLKAGGVELDALAVGNDLAQDGVCLISTNRCAARKTPNSGNALIFVASARPINTPLSR